jgi:putative ABC transport system permease protein
MNSIDLQLVGVFQSFSKEYDNRAVQLPLSAAQELLATSGANVLVVSLRDTSDTERVAEVLRQRAARQDKEVKTWSELNDFHPKTVLLYNRQFGGLLLIILLMVLLSVANSVNMTVFERTSEFGTARALGNRNRDVFRLVMLENVLLGLAGATLGAAIGIVLAKLISLVGIPMPPPPNADLSYVAYVRVSALSLLGAFTIGFSATVLAAVVPALRVARIPVAAALRQAT